MQREQPPPEGTSVSETDHLCCWINDTVQIKQKNFEQQRVHTNAFICCTELNTDIKRCMMGKRFRPRPPCNRLHDSDWAERRWGPEWFHQTAEQNRTNVIWLVDAEDTWLMLQPSPCRCFQVPRWTPPRCPRRCSARSLTNQTDDWNKAKMSFYRSAFSVALVWLLEDRTAAAPPKLYILKTIVVETNCLFVQKPLKEINPRSLENSSSE